MQRLTILIAAICAAALFTVAAISGEGQNLAELADGESRTFGEGDGAVTATRSGDSVTIVGGHTGADPMTCDLATDTCTVAEDGGRVNLAIAREIVCDGDSEDCERADIDLLEGGLLGLSGMHEVWVSEDCDGPECEKKVEIIVNGIGGETGENVFIVDGGTLPVRHGATLRCPEGDATLHVSTEEADDTFLCPKHSVPLEQAKPHFVHKKVRVVREHD